MDFHGITCKGQFITEILSSVPANSSLNQGRIIAVNSSDCFYGGGGSNWYGFILGNNNTTNYLPKITATNMVGNSIISDDGSVSTIHGALSASGNITGLGSLSISGAITTSSVISAASTITGSKVYNTVWNDLADFFELEEKISIEYGKVYIKDERGVHISQKYSETGAIGISSDTYGYGLGIKNKPGFEIPIAVAGIVLAYVDNEYPSGTPLTCTKNGFLTKASIFTRIFSPHLILATFYKKEFNKKYNDIDVNNRCWVKVR